MNKYFGEIELNNLSIEELAFLLKRVDKRNKINGWRYNGTVAHNGNTQIYILYYCILYLSTQTYSLAVRVYLPVQ